GKAFDAIVHDPQSDETDEQPRFERDRFLQTWNEANQFAYRSFLNKPDRPVYYTWASQRLRDTWEWNYGRPPEGVAEDMFVPGVFAVAAAGGEPLSIAVWPPRCTILLPQVDYVLVPIDHDDEKSDTALVAWQEIAPVVAPYQ